MSVLKEKKLIRLRDAPDYLSMSEPYFNKHVRPEVIEIRKGRAVWFDTLDLDAWVCDFKRANGRPVVQKEKILWPKQHPVSERKAIYGKSKKLSAVSEFTKALEKRNSKQQKDTSHN